ncbi:hypothetical protein [Pelagibacterium sediminicola]|uniref:hypothetical protein n=1 Tax=Pelagibacterium sediminicola TaxID=2248761 RepID=UPI000E315071|nr:hypothetical protein [Pelagibacterium sediminicola]
MGFLASFLPMFLGWLARRALELGGIIIAVEQVQPGAFSEIMLTLAALFTGQWHEVSLGTLIGIAGTVGGLIWNGRATFKRPVLTEAEARAIAGYHDGPIERRHR